MGFFVCLVFCEEHSNIWNPVICHSKKMWCQVHSKLVHGEASSSVTVWVERNKCGYSVRHVPKQPHKAQNPEQQLERYGFLFLQLNQNFRDVETQTKTIYPNQTQSTYMLYMLFKVPYDASVHQIDMYHVPIKVNRFYVYSKCCLFCFVVVLFLKFFWQW